MTIQPFAAGTNLIDRQASSLVSLKSSLDAHATQLTTGKTAQTYGGLGAGRATSLSARAAVSALDGYTAAIASATTRVNLATASVSQIKTLSDTARKSLSAAAVSGSAVLPDPTLQLGRNGLSGAIDALNQQAAGVYIFSGRATDRAPVVSQDVMLDGDRAAGLAGLRTLIAEQKRADLGPNGNGRLEQGRAGGTVTLSEGASAEARANFGFSLKGVTSSNGGAITAALTPGTDPAVTLNFAQNPTDGQHVRVSLLLADGSQKTLDLTARANPPEGTRDTFAIGATAEATRDNLRALLGEGARIAGVQSAIPPGLGATFAGGSAARTDLSVTGTPAAGDTVTLALGMRDGTTTTITLTAAASAAADSTTGFAIGATPDETAANLSRTLDNALKKAAGADLSASSTTRASLDFFDGSPAEGLAPRRVEGDGYAEVASKSTVIWYQGDDTDDARATATVQVGASRTVEIGAQANEAGIRRTLAGFAAIAAESFTTTAGTVETDRFKALAGRAASVLGPKEGQASVEDIATELGLASSSMAEAKSAANASKATLLGAIDGVEAISTEEVTVKLLSLQTQLQASYKVTSMLSELSLVNYIG